MRQESSCYHEISAKKWDLLDAIRHYKQANPNYSKGEIYKLIKNNLEYIQRAKGPNAQNECAMLLSERQ